MNYEEARNMIDEMRAEIKAKHMCRSMDGECTSEEVAEYRCRFAALSMGVEALEKMIPTKPNWIYEDEPMCPNCGEIMDDGENPCECCDQLIDWSE